MHKDLHFLLNFTNKIVQHKVRSLQSTESHEVSLIVSCLQVSTSAFFLTTNSPFRVDVAAREDKYNNSVITFRTYPEDIKTIQVGNGKSINKNQVLEIYKDVNKGSFFSASSYVFNIVYKDENFKVSTGKIIFSNKRASSKFEKALIDFGF